MGTKQGEWPVRVLWDSLQSLLAAVLYTVRSEPESLKLAVFTSEKIEFGTVTHFIVTINI